MRTHSDIAAKVSSVAGSTAAIDFPGLPAELGALLEGHARKVASAANAREERVQRIAAAVRAEGGPMPPEMPMGHRVKVVRDRIGARLTYFSLDKAPSVRVVRRELRAVDAEKKVGRFASKGQSDAPTLSAIPTNGGRG